MKSKQLMLLVIVALVSLPLSTSLMSQSLASSPTASSQSGTLTLQVFIWSIDPNSRTINLTIVASLKSNETFSSLPLIQLNSNGQYFQMLLHPVTTRTWEGTTSQQSLYVPGSRPEDFPLDSYPLDFNVTFDGNPARMTNTSLYFQNTNARQLNSISSSWTLLNQIPRTAVGGLSIDFIRNPSIGLLILLPVAVAFVLLGSAFFLSSDKLSDRLLIVTSIFVFAPVFFFAIQPEIPIRNGLSLIEQQLVLLLFGVGIFGAGSTISSNRVYPRQKITADYFAFYSILVTLLLVIAGPQSVRTPAVVQLYWFAMIGVYFIFAEWGIIGRESRIHRFRRKPTVAEVRLTRGWTYFKNSLRRKKTIRETSQTSEDEEPSKGEKVVPEGGT